MRISLQYDTRNYVALKDTPHTFLLKAPYVAVKDSRPTLLLKTLDLRSS